MQVMASNERPPNTTDTVLRAASGAAGIAAIIAGSLYATSAVVRTAELRDAELCALDALHETAASQSHAPLKVS